MAESLLPAGFAELEPFAPTWCLATGDQRYGGKVLVVGSDVQLLEGEWHGTRTVVVVYESVAKAREWYESPSYQAALPLRQAAADCNVVIAAGFELGRQ